MLVYYIYMLYIGSVFGICMAFPHRAFMMPTVNAAMGYDSIHCPIESIEISPCAQYTDPYRYIAGSQPQTTDLQILSSFAIRTDGHMRGVRTRISFFSDFFWRLL